MTRAHGRPLLSIHSPPERGLLAQVQVRVPGSMLRALCRARKAANMYESSRVCEKVEIACEEVRGGGGSEGGLGLP